MQVYLGSDHAGFNLKKQIKAYLVEKFNGKDGFSVLDLGVFTNDATDYPDIAREVCEKAPKKKLTFPLKWIYRRIWTLSFTR
jgi:ribose 5-phosphate isomerase B